MTYKLNIHMFTSSILILEFSVSLSVPKFKMGQLVNQFRWKIIEIFYFYYKAIHEYQKMDTHKKTYLLMRSHQYSSNLSYSYVSFFVPFGVPLPHSSSSNETRCQVIIDASRKVFQFSLLSIKRLKHTRI